MGQGPNGGVPGGSSLRAAYVILTHKDWAQVQRLVRAIRLSSPDAYVLIAHDSRSVRFPSSVDDPRVEILDHGLATDWGSWELVEATLLAFRHVRARIDPHLVCLVSGQDYPVRRLAEWESEVLAAESWVGTAEELHYTPHWGRRRGEGQDALTRYTYRWFQSPAARIGWRSHGRLGRAWRKARSAAFLRVEPLLSVRIVARGRGVYYGIRRARAPFSADRPCFFGSQWLALRRRELDWLLDEDYGPRSPLARLYRRAIIPDESALVTALSWRARPSALPQVSHVTWDAELDQPVTCTIDDLGALLASGSAFCRKVEADASASLMDQLDRITVAEWNSRPS